VISLAATLAVRVLNPIANVLAVALRKKEFQLIILTTNLHILMSHLLAILLINNFPAIHLD